MAPAPLSDAATEIPVDVSGRPLRLRAVDLDHFLHPRTVAVVGASEAGGKPNTVMTRKLGEWASRHGARLVPVTPVYPEVLGIATVPTLADVRVPIDLAVLLTGTERVVGHFADAVEAGARFAVIFSAGFSEVGPAGARLERELERLATSGGTRLLGPNTNLNAFETFRDDLDGPAIALITQSGHQGRPIFQGQEIGIRLSHWAPTGNEVDLEFADFCRYFADQADVGVVAAYIEGFKDGRTMQLAADHAAAARKPLVVVKVGRTDAGRSMAMSHTGHLTGADRVVDAAFRQHGVTRVDGLDELLEVSAMFARTTAPADPERCNVCVYAISGGTGAHMADMAAAAGLRLPTLAPATQRALHAGLVPPYLRVSNPVDCGGPPVTDERGRKILDLLVADPAVDMLIVPITGALDTMSGPLARDLVAVAETTTKPILVVWGSPVGTEAPYRDTLLGSRLPVFRSFGNCVRAARAYFDYWSFVDRYESPFADAPVEPLPAARRARRLVTSAEPGASLSEVDSKRVLAAYGIRSSRDRLCTSAAEAARAARDLGFPVVMKVVSADLPHKSDLGLVEVGVGTAAAARETYGVLLRRAQRARVGGRRPRIDGILVSEMVTAGVEALVGVTRDPLFGPVVTVGLGGVLVEVLDDVAVGVPPFGRGEAERMIDGLKCAQLLSGTRGRAGVDREALVDVVMKVQRLALDLADDVAEVDVNPLVVKRKGAVALDALVVRAGARDNRKAAQ
jgi:acyl-CoA synthetase (NDP forming)